MSRRDDYFAELGRIVARVADEAPELLPELAGEIERLVGERAAASNGDPAAAGVDSEVAADPAVEDWHGLTGSSQPMLALRRLLEKFGPANAPVLITGESGTGKERVAQALHALSKRHDRELVAENCAAIPATLLESVLFGHKKGAFTGAIADHPGHFVAAHKGTLFLDEIGEMALSLQAKLLRVLQEGEVRPVGGSKTRKIDVRVIAATNQDLEARVRAGKFREDLFFRLNVLRVETPALRQRGSDIVMLARLFLAEAAKVTGREIRLGPDAAAALAAAPWPGNVRQLQNEMQRAAALLEGSEVGLADLSPDLR
ncbi:MAG: sigma-54 dependent transcriptional regulator [bacterium]|nr:sigma-54 dependent transcriptional regulator [bacterium]